jgi:hypothetical protein
MRPAAEHRTRGTGSEQVGGFSGKMQPCRCMPLSCQLHRPPSSMSPTWHGLPKPLSPLPTSPAIGPPRSSLGLACAGSVAACHGASTDRSGPGHPLPPNPSTGNGSHGAVSRGRHLFSKHSTLKISTGGRDTSRQQRDADTRPLGCCWIATSSLPS